MKNYLNICEKIIKFQVDDDAYIEEYIKSFYSICYNKIGAIKDVDSKYIMATNNFVALVGLNSIGSIIHLTDIQLPCSMANYSKKYKEQDEMIIKYKSSQSYIEIQEFATGIGVYKFTKSPIINPKTNNILGVLINVEPFQVTNMMDVMLEMHTKRRNVPLNTNSFGCNKANISLGPKQTEVLFCLSLGIKEDKYIADFIKKVLNIEYGIVHIRDIVRDLLAKFNVCKREELLEEIVKQKLHTSFPLHFLKFGSHYIRDATSSIKEIKKTTNPTIRGVSTSSGYNKI